ncbi:MAG: hypothetical protein WCC32_13600 [Terriglobales bacterium]
MRHKIQMPALIVTLVLMTLTPALLSAQVSLADQLNAQYNLVKMGEDSNGAAVIEAGTILEVKKGGILSVPYGDQSGAMATKYQDGTVHSPNAGGMKLRGFALGKFGKTQTTQFFQVGNKVYPTRIQVNADKDQVVLGIVSCDSCNNISPTTFYKADVVFQFNKGGLAKMAAPQVEDAIAGLLAISDNQNSQGGDQGNNNGGNDQGNNNNGGNNNAGNGNDQGGGGGGGGQAQNQPAPEPAQIEKGMTPDQVKNAIGVPDKIINLGAKQIYVYKDIKVTFLNGKVSDVQ